MTNAERKKKHNDKVAKEITAYKEKHMSYDELSATAKARLNRKAINKRAYMNRKKMIQHSKEMTLILEDADEENKKVKSKYNQVRR